MFFRLKQEGLMTKIKLAAILAAFGLLSLMLACENSGESANANANDRNTNQPAATVNTNSSTSNANTNTKSNSNRAPTREEYDRDKARYEREAKDSGRTIGTGLNDGWLWAKTRYDLAAADDLRDSTINVDVDNGIVTLTGTVPSAAQKAKAETTVKAVEGVKSIKNLLKIAPNTNANTAPANTNKPRK